MFLIPVFISFAFSTSFSMVIPSSNNNIQSNITTLHVRVRVNNSFIETLVNKKQFSLIEIQLQEKHIPYRQVEDNQDKITIIIEPFEKSKNIISTIKMFNQSYVTTNLTDMLSINNSTIDRQGQNVSMTIKSHEYNLIHDQESYEFVNCLKSCEIYDDDDDDLKPDHNCIRKKCLKEITGI